MEALQLLSRSEMKMIKGGDPNQPCSEGQSCLYCNTPGGTETWCRNSLIDQDQELIDPMDECGGIYPAYDDPGDVTGTWGMC